MRQCCIDADTRRHTRVVAITGRSCRVKDAQTVNAEGKKAPKIQQTERVTLSGAKHGGQNARGQNERTQQVARATAPLARRTSPDSQRPGAALRLPSLRQVKHASRAMNRMVLLLVVFLSAGGVARAGTLAQFRTVFGDIEVELYDQDKPVTVQNFIHYVQSGAWNQMFFHRCEPTFVIQGGGYFVANRSTTNQFLSSVTNYGTIVNEFAAGRRFSNVYGTIAMAKRSGDTNSASSQWFFNLNDNSFLDAADTNNLFVVFGHVVDGTNALNVFKTFSPNSTTNTIFNLSGQLGGAFAELPLLTSAGTYDDLLYVDVSLLHVQVASSDNNTREISWNSVSNRVNHVEFTAGLPPAWQTLVSTNGTGAVLKILDSDPAAATRFYRVLVDYP